MVEKVEAWIDAKGRIFKTRREAVNSEFTNMVRSAWEAMPSRTDVGDPVVIAQCMSSGVYPAVRTRLGAALDFLAENLV